MHLSTTFETVDKIMFMRKMIKAHIAKSKATFPFFLNILLILSTQPDLHERVLFQLDQLQE